MNDAFTVTLIILIVALLRRSLLSDPGAPYGTRAGWKETGEKTLALASVKADSPHTAASSRPK